MKFKMPCLGRYLFDTDGTCYRKNGRRVIAHKGSAPFYRIVDDRGAYNRVAIAEIQQYGRHLYPGMRTVAESILYPLRQSGANAGGDGYD